MNGSTESLLAETNYLPAALPKPTTPHPPISHLTIALTHWSVPTDQPSPAHTPSSRQALFAMASAVCHPSWLPGQRITPEILDMVLARMKDVKAEHKAQWDSTHGAHPSSTGQATTPGGSQQAVHKSDQHPQDILMAFCSQLPRELTIKILEWAALQYLESRRPFLEQVPQNGEWRRDRFLTWPIKNMCAASRRAYIEMLDELGPVYMFYIDGSCTRQDFEEWAPIDGSSWDLYLCGQSGTFFNQWIPKTPDLGLASLKTIYMHPGDFLRLGWNWWEGEPPKALTKGCNYYRAKKSGTSSGAIQLTQISPSDTNLFESVLFSTPAEQFPWLGEGRAPIELNRMWCKSAQMIRQPNNDLVFIFAEDMPWVIGELQLRFLFMRFRPCFRRLPQLQRLVFVEQISDINDLSFLPYTAGTY